MSTVENSNYEICKKSINLLFKNAIQLRGAMGLTLCSGMNTRLLPQGKEKCSETSIYLSVMYALVTLINFVFYLTNAFRCVNLLAI